MKMSSQNSIFSYLLSKHLISPYLISTTLLAGVGWATIPVAQASTFHNGWNYAIDSFNDGFHAGKIGEGSSVEIYGLATKEEGDRLYFALNSNLSINGILNRRAYNNRLSYGDLFLNFSNSNVFNPSSDDIYAIRFDPGNDTLGRVGLYQNVQAASLTQVNLGFADRNQYHAAVQNRGGTVSYGDIAPDYFANSPSSPTTLSAGTLIGGVQMVSDLTPLNLDFEHFGAKGNHTFSFSVDRNLLPEESFTAHLFVESGNEGIALRGELQDTASQDIPEPSFGLAFGLVGWIVLKMKRDCSENEAIAMNPLSL